MSTVDADIHTFDFWARPWRERDEAFDRLRDETMLCAEHMAAWSDPEELGDLEPIELFANAAFRLNDFALELTELRRDDPADDLLTWVIQAEFEGQRLEDWEIGSFFSLLAAAANDTTRHTITHALLAFEQHPEQKALLLEDLEGRVDLGFGGGGPHFCLGSNLAGQTLRAALLEVYGRLPDITVSEPEYLVANFAHGIKRLRGRWTPAA